jgi:hypothetical protein
LLPKLFRHGLLACRERTNVALYLAELGVEVEYERLKFVDFHRATRRGCLNRTPEQTGHGQLHHALSPDSTRQRE